MSNPMDWQPLFLALQCGEISTGRARELVPTILAGEFTEDMLPPVSEVFGMDDFPAEICTALRARIAALEGAIERHNARCRTECCNQPGFPCGRDCPCPYIIEMPK